MPKKRNRNNRSRMLSRSHPFWCRGYYVDTVGKNTKKIAEYIRTQLEEDIAEDQINIKEYIDPFSGKKKK
jgi:putative transposase